MKIAIVYGKFYSLSTEDFTYLQSGLTRGDELIIIIGQSDRQDVIATHIHLLKLTDYIIRLKDNETYQSCLNLLIGLREASPKEGIDLIWVNNSKEPLENIKLQCDSNGVFYID